MSIQQDKIIGRDKTFYGALVYNYINVTTMKSLILAQDER